MVNYTVSASHFTFFSTHNVDDGQFQIAHHFQLYSDRGFVYHVIVFLVHRSWLRVFVCAVG